MKKNIIIVLLLSLLVLYPLKVSAASIQSTSFYGNNEKAIGEELSLSFGISFSDIYKGKSDSLGIWFVAYELIFDDTVFIVSDI